MLKWIIFCQGQYNMSLEHLIIPERNEVLKTKQNKPERMKYQRDTGTNLKELPITKLEQFQQQNKQYSIVYNLT